MRFPIAALLVLLPVVASAQDGPRIKIVKSSRLNIAVAGLAGADLEALRRDLVNSGYFAITPPDKAQYTASGGGGESQGVLTDRGGRTLLSKSYGGAGRARIHRFADDIVETLTGAPGIASTKIAFVSTRTGRKEIHTCDAETDVPPVRLLEAAVCWAS